MPILMMLIFEKNKIVVKQTKSFLTLYFDMKYIGEVNVSLGLKLTKIGNGYMLS